VHNLQGKSTVTLNTLGGLVAYAGPDSIPSGASPRCHDVDFAVGSVRSRFGTRNVYSFADLLVAHAGNAATSSTWNNPSASYGTTTFATSSGLDSSTLDVTEFAFSVTQPTTGIEVTLNGLCNTSATYNVTLIQDGIAIGVPNTASAGTISLGGPSDLWGAAANVNDTTFGIRIEANSEFPLAAYQVNSVKITVYLAGSGNNFNYIKSFIASNGDIKTLALDASGEMWVEDVTNNAGVLTPLIGNLTPQSYAKSTTADDREYIAISDLSTGSDMPRQYTGEWVDRITQVGPGAPPTFTRQEYTADHYAIDTISQPAGHANGYSYFLSSQGPGNTSPGNVITVYYQDSTTGGVDSDLVTAFNSGNPVYLYFSFTGVPTPYGPYVVLVTSVGQSSPPGQPRSFYYFTFISPQNVSVYAYSPGSGHPGYTANYQRTLATLTTSVPVPGLVTGNNITVDGNSVANWNNGWTITQAINSGSFNITQTSVASGVATYSYALTGGVAPVAGEQVTITGTTNANGGLNGTNVIIIAASGGSSGTFTVNVSVPDAPNSSEQGQGVTAGTIFAFDPGQALNGTSTSPIYGNGTGGYLIFAGTAQYINAGTYQGVVFFGTRNDAETAPSIPVVFTIPSNTSTILSSQIPIGPPDTTYRQIALTEPGQLGVPGGNFYTIDTPVTYTVNGISYVSNSFRINDNTTTSAAFTFRVSDLLSARPIDVQGQDLFNQIEIGNPAWITQYAGRNVYGLTQAKVQNFVNLSFDGGYTPGTTKQPLGWGVSGNSGQLLVSPSFGNSYYIQNTSGITQSTLGLISQTAYQDYYGVAILRPNVAYSVRLSARCPSGNTIGNLLISVTSNNATVGSFVVPFASMSTVMQNFTGAFYPSTSTIPGDLTLTVQATEIGNDADVEIDRIEFYPTRQPVNNTQLMLSYVANPEGVDGVSGIVDTNSENPQPCYGAVVMYDLLYLLKDRSMYYTQDSSGDEPSGWGVHEVSNKAGACGVNAYDSGEEWIEMANRNGIYSFEGGTPRKYSQEIQEVWDAINWDAGRSIWLRKDVESRTTYIGIPLPTPNFWLPYAPENAAPAFPNVVLICNTVGQGTGGAIADADPIRDTVYGNLIAEELHRKWTLWQIPSPYADFITQQNGSDAPLLFGNGLGNSKIYAVDATNDDGVEIPWRYTTYGFGSDDDAKKMPALGSGRKRWSYLIASITGIGSAVATFYSNRLDAQTKYTTTMDLTADDFDREQPLNIPGNRVYVEFASGGINTSMDFSQLTMVGSKDTFNSLTGRA
jgi:hypothetical protein